MGTLGHLGKDLLGAESALLGPEREVWGECQDPEFLLRFRGDGVTETKSATECGGLVGFWLGGVEG